MTQDEEKQSCLKILQLYGPSVFGNNMTGWWVFRRRLDNESIVITGNEKKITIKGLCQRVGQFTEAEVWEERYYRSFANLGLELEFQP